MYLFQKNKKYNGAMGKSEPTNSLNCPNFVCMQDNWNLRYAIPVFISSLQKKCCWNFWF